MIETNAIKPGGAPVACAHCRKALYTVFPPPQEQAFEGYLYSDGDAVPTRSSASLPAPWEERYSFIILPVNIPGMQGAEPPPA